MRRGSAGRTGNTILTCRAPTPHSTTINVPKIPERVRPPPFWMHRPAERTPATGTRLRQLGVASARAEEQTYSPQPPLLLSSVEFPSLIRVFCSTRRRRLCSPPTFADERDASVLLCYYPDILFQRHDHVIKEDTPCTPASERVEVPTAESRPATSTPASSKVPHSLQHKARSQGPIPTPSRRAARPPALFPDPGRSCLEILITRRPPPPAAPRALHRPAATPTHTHDSGGTYLESIQLCKHAFERRSGRDFFRRGKRPCRRCGRHGLFRPGEGRLAAGNHPSTAGVPRMGQREGRAKRAREMESLRDELDTWQVAEANSVASQFRSRQPRGATVDGAVSQSACTFCFYVLVLRDRTLLPGVLPGAGDEPPAFSSWHRGFPSQISC